MVLTLGNLPFWAVSVLVAVFVFVSVVMILTVLIQRPQGGGLSGAFGAGGGAGAGQTAFGAKTGDALTMATIIIFVVYLLVAIGLNYAARPVDPTVNQPTIGSTDEGVGGDIEGDAPTGESTIPPDGAGDQPPADEPGVDQAQPAGDPAPAEGADSPTP